MAYNVSAERAFETLVWRSQEANLKLREVASRFLAALAHQAASLETQSQLDQALLTLE
jgi:ANTAR domain